MGKSSVNTLAKKNAGISHDKMSLQAQRAKVDILEMEDVLFHLNSAVFLPDKPQGASSSQGDKDSALQKKQEKLSGLKALAIVFRQDEFDPRKKLLVAAHTDTSGEVEPNFKLSIKRGQSFVSLLTGDKELWANTCSGQQRVEDYQQIMKYYYFARGWSCYPGSIDNKCGNKTMTASGKFFEAYGELHDDPETAGDYPEALPPGLNEQIRKDPNRFWPPIAWKAVYDLYMGELCSILQISRKHLEGMRKDRIVARWVDPKKPFVACGESFPLQHPEKSNYRSQKNRRVEILFFHEKETPDKINCPPRLNSVHISQECPIWYDRHMMVNYVDPDYLTAEAFHLKFAYYDRIYQDFKQVPEGLDIKAFKIGEVKPLEVGHDFSAGIYTLRILNLKKSDVIYFEFNTVKSPDGKKRQWVYTKSKTEPPVLREMTDDDVSKLSFKERMNYYDLPAEWSSRNYFTRHDGNENAGDEFETILKNYKPFGAKATSPGKPLVFSLDDVVLVDSALSQNINNSAGDKPQDLDQDNTKTDLSADSRVTIYYLDELADYKIEIYKPKTSHPYFSDIAFTKNLITDRVPEASKPRLTRVIIFCSGFYDVTDKRTTKTAKFKFEQNHILGARAAVLNDPSASAMAAVQANPASGVVTAAMKDYVQSWCGNYEFHYLHNCGILKGYLDTTEKPLSYLMIYWQGRYALHPGTTAADIGNDWREKHEKFGITNAMTRTNRPYLLEKKDGATDIIIKPYCHYEAKLVTDEANFKGPGGKHNCRVEVSKVVGAWMQPALAKFHVANYQAEAGYYGSDAYLDVDGSTLYSSHESSRIRPCHGAVRRLPL